MPLSHAASSSNRQAAGVSNKRRSGGIHHQTVYDDGRGRCIVECRRRSNLVYTANAPSPGRSPRPTTSNATLSQEWLSPVSPFDPSPTTSSKYGERLAPHVTFAKHLHKPLVIASATPETPAKKTHESISASQKWEELTPPPTPRLDRLPTPELPDLDEAPFCDCDEATLVRYCKSCKKEFDPSSSWY